MSSPRSNPVPVKTLKHVSVMGSGGWGSVVARIIARNVLTLSKFHPKVLMYVFEELIEDRTLTEIINKDHENVKYAPGLKFTTNLVAVADAVETAKNADILIFVVPHQFIQHLCKTISGRIKPGAIGISLIKGFLKKTGGGIELISHVITDMLKIPCHVLMGANIAGEVGAEKIKCRSTLGCSNKSRKKLLKSLFQTDHLKITVVDDEDTVEICGALKNIIATGVGFMDGLDADLSMKEAFLRLGFMEIIEFVDHFYPGAKLATFFESCGIEDMIVTSFAGRNRKCAELFIRTGKTLSQLEKEVLDGQILQGPPTAEEVCCMLNNTKTTSKFPLFKLIDGICRREVEPESLLRCIEQNFRKRMYIPKTIVP